MTDNDKVEIILIHVGYHVGTCVLYSDWSFVDHSVVLG